MMSIFKISEMKPSGSISAWNIVLPETIYDFFMICAMYCELSSCRIYELQVGTFIDDFFGIFKSVCDGKISISMGELSLSVVPKDRCREGYPDRNDNFCVEVMQR